MVRVKDTSLVYALGISDLDYEQMPQLNRDGRIPTGEGDLPYRYRR